MSSINIIITFVFSTFLLSKFTNCDDKCLEKYAIGCDNNKNKCCGGNFKCQRTFDNTTNHRPRYQCLERDCKEINCDDDYDRCCYGFACVRGECRPCNLDGGRCNPYHCCLGYCNSDFDDGGKCTSYPTQ
ncbi:hypothetical protein ACQ4LE_010478 [Meloidogyne hapla]